MVENSGWPLPTKDLNIDGEIPFWNFCGESSLGATEYLPLNKPSAIFVIWHKYDSAGLLSPIAGSNDKSKYLLLSINIF